MTTTLHELLSIVVEREASDLHLSCDTNPQIRIDGSLEALEQFERLASSDVQRLIYSVLTEPQRQRFEAGHDLDLSIDVEELARFRCNVYRQRGVMGAAMRRIPYTVPSFEQLHLPPVVEQLTNKPAGLVLVTGPTGSGKSTTLAAMIDKINSERRAHIVTIEDPIEFVHRHKRALVHQREVMTDTPSFRDALRSIPREDPDVVLVGEMRDLETIAATLTIAETGHLTFATLHTKSCAQTIHRIIDVFPTGQQNQIRAQLSMVLEGVLSQALVPGASGRGRALAVEVMVTTPAIRNLIRQEKIHEIYSMLQSGGRLGMQTMSQALVSLVSKGRISATEARTRATQPDEVEDLLGGAPVRASTSANGHGAKMDFRPR